MGHLGDDHGDGIENSEYSAWAGIGGDEEERGEGSESVEGNDDDTEGDEEGDAKPGCFSECLQKKLLELQADYERKVTEIAAAEHKSAQACWRFLNENAQTPQEIMPFNAFQKWYCTFGETKKWPDHKCSRLYLNTSANSLR